MVTGQRIWEMRAKRAYLESHRTMGYCLGASELDGREGANNQELFSDDDGREPIADWGDRLRVCYGEKVLKERRRSYYNQNISQLRMAA